VRPAIKEFAPKSIADLFFVMLYARWRLPFRTKYQPLVEGKDGIEIGGPSALFETVLPVYQLVENLDGVNFGTHTVWEGRIEAEQDYTYYANKHGRQLIAEATDLGQVATERYDFLLSSNCLEHVANPIKALLEWRRVIKVGGGFVLVLPNKESNFDHRRPVTEFAHLLDDYRRDVGEDDLTHVDEILALHDLSMDAPAGGPDRFRERSLKNVENRTLHHHVFDLPLMEKVLDHVGFEIVDLTATRTDFFALATKSATAPTAERP